MGILVDKKVRLTVYEALFKDGVLVSPALKKSNAIVGMHKLGVRNLHVVKLMQSLESKGFVTHTYNWKWNYYYLTNEGIEYLRDYLHLAAEVVPATLKTGPGARSERGERGERGDYGGGAASGKAGAQSADWKPKFGEGGAGRGRGAGAYRAAAPQE